MLRCNFQFFRYSALRRPSSDISRVVRCTERAMFFQPAHPSLPASGYQLNSVVKSRIFGIERVLALLPKEINTVNAIHEHGQNLWGTLFQRSINKTCCSKRDNFITKDTLETASHFYVKIVYKHNLTCSKVHAGRGRGAGVD
jgi:hypothetical protein